MPLLHYNNFWSRCPIVNMTPQIKTFLTQNYSALRTSKIWPLDGVVAGHVQRPAFQALLFAMLRCHIAAQLAAPSGGLEPFDPVSIFKPYMLVSLRDRPWAITSDPRVQLGASVSWHEMWQLTLSACFLGSSDTMLDQLSA